MEGGDYWEATVQVLQSGQDPLVQKPKLSQKLLSKPPFRFLHDVISAVQVKTGFAQGLFEGEELDGKAIKDKEAKLAYLNKIVAVVGICVGQKLDVKPTKIIAGLEPEQTNKFLQALGAAAMAGDGQEAVKVVLQDSSTSNQDQRRQSSHRGEMDNPEERPMSTDMNNRKVEPQNETVETQNFENPANFLQQEILQENIPVESAPPVEDTKPEKDHKQQVRQPAAQQPRPTSVDKEVKQQTQDYDKVASSGGGEVSTLKPIRPQSAKKAPPRIVQQHEARMSVQRISEEPKIVGVMQEGDVDDDDNVIDVVHEAPSTITAIDNNGQQGALVGEILAAGEKFKEASDNQQENSNEQQSGGGIVLKRAGKAQEGVSQKVQDAAQLQSTIQKFCSSINPLGKCLDFLEENLENMNLELNFWVQEQRSQQANLGALQSNSTGPEIQQVQTLKSQISAAEKQIEQGQERANALKAQIFQNDQTISKLLDMAILGT